MYVCNEMYVCMYVCAVCNVCMYVMYVCMYVCMYLLTVDGEGKLEPADIRN